jgi:hypothetical protein
MAALAREELRGADHPSTARLIAYHRGEIPPAEAAVIREHLSFCGECAALLLDAAEFFAEEEGEDAAPTDPADLETSWQELQAALSGGGERSPATVPALRPPSAAPIRSLARSLSFAYGLAATFAAVSIGLLLFRAQALSPRPQVNPGLYDLTPSGSERSEGESVVSIRFQSPEDSAFLIFNPSVAASSNTYGVRIRGTAGPIAWQSDDLVLQATGAFHLSLPARALPPGRYSLELYGVTAGRETPLGAYRIAIEK